MNRLSSEMHRSSYSQERMPCFLAFVFETEVALCDKEEVYYIIVYEK